MIEEKNPTLTEKHLEKSPIGITGFDEITDCDCQRAARRLYMGVQAQEKLSWPWSFWSREPKSMMSQESL